MAYPQLFSENPAERRRLFKTALAYLGETRIEWAARHGLNLSTVDAVRNNDRNNPKVAGLIDATILEFRRRVVRDIPLPRRAA